MPSPRDLRPTLDRLNTTLAASEKKSRRQQKRGARQQRRDSRDSRRLKNASRQWGIAQFVIAGALAMAAIAHPHHWWFIFIAASFLTSGARQFALVARRERQEREEAPVEPEGSATAMHEIDALCDQLLTDLRASPEVVRAFLQNPEQAVEGLRAAAKAIDARRKTLTGSGTASLLQGLATQRAELSQRRDSASDPTARSRFDSALRSLERQQAALEQLTAASERLDGEYASLLVLLQEMRTRVAVARSTDPNGSQLALEQNVQRINAELEAITESLQQVPDEGLLEPISPIEAPSGGPTDIAPDSRERTS